MSKLGGSVARNRFFGNTFTLSTSATRVLRRRRCTGKERKTPSSDKMLVHRMTTSGCCAHTDGRHARVLESGETRAR